MAFFVLSGINVSAINCVCCFNLLSPQPACACFVILRPQVQAVFFLYIAKQFETVFFASDKRARSEVVVGGLGDAKVTSTDAASRVFSHVRRSRIEYFSCCCMITHNEYSQVVWVYVQSVRP